MYAERQRASFEGHGHWRRPACEESTATCQQQLLRRGADAKAHDLPLVERSDVPGIRLALSSTPCRVPVGVPADLLPRQRLERGQRRGEGRRLSRAVDLALVERPGRRVGYCCHAERWCWRQKSHCGATETHPAPGQAGCRAGRASFERNLNASRAQIDIEPTLL